MRSNRIAMFAAAVMASGLGLAHPVVAAPSRRQESEHGGPYTSSRRFVDSDESKRRRERADWNAAVDAKKAERNRRRGR